MKAIRLLSQRHPRAILFVACTAWALGACTEDFDPQSKVSYLRILAIQAETPRLAAGENTAVQALAVTEDPDRLINLTWEICPFTGPAIEGYPCLFPPEAPQAWKDALTADGDRFDFTYDAIFAAAVDLLCSQQLPPSIPLPSCTQGYPARVRLTAAAGEEQVVAVKTLYLIPSQPESAVSPNANPRLNSLEPDPEAPIQPRVGEDFPIRCEIDDASRETFTRADEDQPRREEILLSWFVRNGKLDKDVSFYSDIYGDADEAQNNTLTPASAGPATVWCVARDGRGGTDWRQLDLMVDP